MKIELLQVAGHGLIEGRGTMILVSKGAGPSHSFEVDAALLHTALKVSLPSRTLDLLLKDMLTDYAGPHSDVAEQAEAVIHHINEVTKGSRK